jgi:putative ABC transport system permease protein
VKGIFLKELFSYFRHERRRTAIAMLGIAIGVLSLVLMDSISGAMNRKIEMELGRMGGSLIMLLPEEIRSVGQRRILLSRYTTLKAEDIDAISEKIGFVKAVSAFKKKAVSVQTALDASTLTVTGCQPVFVSLLDYRLRAGRTITRHDMDTYAKVAIIGSKIAAQFFAGPATGRTIYLSGLPFKVIGTLEERGSFSNEDFDEVILVPLTTHMRVLENVDYLDGAVILASSRGAIENAIRETGLLLLQRHGERDFSLNTYQELQGTTSKTLRLFSVLSRIVASIAFSVGTLGILAIMALSIYERLLEIAIKRVTGARKVNIFMQFLAESLVLSMAGSIAGISISVFIAIPVQILAGWPLYLPWTTMGISVALSVATGMAAGIYPAVKALEFEPKAILRLFEEA